MDKDPQRPAGPHPQTWLDVEIAGDELVVRARASLLRRLADRTRKIAFAAPPPELGADPKQCRKRHALGLADTSEAELRQLRALSNNHIHDAIRFDGTAQIADPWQLLAAVENHFQAKGGKMNCRHVDDTRQIDTDYIAIAAGAASKSLLARYELHAPLIAERRYWSALEKLVQF